MNKEKLLPAISAETLFHYTKKAATLKKILRNGIRFSYCLESSVPEITQGIMIPMVSFCDIPLSKIARHSQKYGCYCIGINKEYLKNQYNTMINPVLYMESDNMPYALTNLFDLQVQSYEEYMNSVIAKAAERYNQLSDSQKDTLAASEIVRSIFKEHNPSNVFDCKFSMNFLLGLIKPTYSPDGYCFHDEREWRIFWPDGLDNREWIWDVDTVSKEEIDLLNARIASSEDGYVTVDSVDFNMVNYIIVKDDAQIPPMIRFIMKSRCLLGNTDISLAQRLFLISRITSFERLSKDL